MIVLLTWNPSACPGTLGYNIYRAQAVDGDYLQIAANVTAPNYTDQPDTIFGGSYWYKISSIDSDGEGLLSSAIEAPAYPGPTAPTNLAALVNNGCVGPNLPLSGYGIGGYGEGGYG